VKKEYDNKTYSTPPGTASWPKVVDPDTTFDADGQWNIKLVFDASDPKVKEMQKAIVAFNKTQPDYNKDSVAYPWGPYKNEDKEVVEGKVAFSFKRKCLVKKDGKKEKNKPPNIIDADGEVWHKCPMGGGSTVQVGYQMVPYTGFGKVGISLRLQGVRVLELVEYKAEADWGDYKGSAKAPAKVLEEDFDDEDDIPVGGDDDDDEDF
jgi:hypothetical protein